MAVPQDVMDYGEHERTFGRFMRMLKVGIVQCLTVVICLVLIGFGGGGGKILGGIMVLVSLLASAIDLGTGAQTPRVGIGVFILTVLLTALVV